MTMFPSGPTYSADVPPTCTSNSFEPAAAVAGAEPVMFNRTPSNETADAFHVWLKSSSGWLVVTVAPVPISGRPAPPAGTDHAPVAFKKDVAAAPLLPGTTPCAVVLVENGMRTAVACVGVRSP